MRIGKLEGAVEKILDADLVPMIWGGAGIGKSRVVGTYFNRVCSNGWFDVRAAQISDVDVRGLPKFIEGGTMTWSPPSTFPWKEKQGLFLDEINLGQRSTLAALYQVILDKSIGDLRFAPDAKIVCAGNEAMHSSLINEMPLPLKNRLVHISVETDIDDWGTWAVKSGIHSNVLAFIRFRPSLLDELSNGHFDTSLEGEKKGKKEVKLRNPKDIKGFGTPRTWEAVSRLRHLNPDPSVAHELYAGCVGSGAAAEFIGYERVYKNLPNFADILKNPTKAPIPKEISEQYAISTGLAEHCTLHNFDQILAYAERLPSELQVMIVMDCMHRVEDLAMTPSFARWGMKNAQLITA